MIDTGSDHKGSVSDDGDDYCVNCTSFVLHGCCIRIIISPVLDGVRSNKKYANQL